MFVKIKTIPMMKFPSVRLIFSSPPILRQLSSTFIDTFAQLKRVKFYQINAIMNRISIHLTIACVNIN